MRPFGKSGQDDACGVPRKPMPGVLSAFVTPAREPGSGLGEPLFIGHGPGPEFLDGADVIQMEQGPIAPEIRGCGRIDQLGRIIGAHLEEHLEVELSLIRSAQTAVEVVQSVEPEQGMDTDKRAVSQDVCELLVGSHSGFFWRE